MNTGVLESQGNNTLFIFRFGWKQKKYCNKDVISVNVQVQYSEHSSDITSCKLQQHISILWCGQKCAIANS
jgi:hypothetical protein